VLTVEQKARQQLEKREHGLKVRLGLARAAARRAATLEEKVARYRTVKELQRALDLLRRNYWAEIEKLEGDD